MKRVSAVALLAGLCSAPALAGELKVIDAQARFPEGPVWEDGKLYYVQYGGHTVKVWDGSRSSEFWKSRLQPAEDRGFIAAVDDTSQAPWPGKVYEVPLN